MKHEIKKISLIVNEMLKFFMSNSINEIDVKLKKGEKQVSIFFEISSFNFGDEFIENLRYNLCTKRQCEVEGYYWQLVGDVEFDEGIYLVGTMVDKAIIDKKNDVLYIKLIRNISK